MAWLIMKLFLPHQLLFNGGGIVLAYILIPILALSVFLVCLFLFIKRKYFLLGITIFICGFLFFREDDLTSCAFFFILGSTISFWSAHKYCQINKPDVQKTLITLYVAAMVSLTLALIPLTLSIWGISIALQYSNSSFDWRTEEKFALLTAIGLAFFSQILIGIKKCRNMRLSSTAP